MQRDKFGGEGARYVIVAAIVVVAAMVTWSMIKKSYEYGSLTVSHKCAVIVNKTMVFPLAAFAPDTFLLKYAYGLRDALFEHGADGERPEERSCAWLAVYFGEYLAKNCGNSLDETEPPDNETYTGPISCSDAVLDEAMRQLLFLARQKSLPEDFVELYYVNAFFFTAGFAARARAHGGRVKREHFDAVYSLLEPEFTGIFSVSDRGGAYRSLLRSMRCLFEIEQGKADPELGLEQFRDEVNSAARQGKHVSDRVLRKILAGIKNLPAYKGGALPGGAQ